VGTDSSWVSRVMVKGGPHCGEKKTERSRGGVAGGESGDEIRHRVRGLIQSSRVRKKTRKRNGLQEAGNQEGSNMKGGHFRTRTRIMGGVVRKDVKCRTEGKLQPRGKLT